ncbi:MAG: DUF2796 domain-containing protein [Thiohalocapsa sp.]|nr:DUF2796 domain-containing protein [Thiohalocapsa sp.]MCF7988826.1 DUF2796 domain-containing protein [Thiohalocapsa sp.]
MRKANNGTMAYLLLTALGVAGAAAAGEGHDHQHREHDAHVHGVASLNVAVDGDKLLIELDSPAVNLVGFEHAPRDDAQRAAVAKVKEQLADGAALFVADAAAGCTLDTHAIDMALAKHDEAAHDHDHDHDHVEAGDGDHAHGEETAHADAHDHDGDTHSDVHVEYAFTCANPQALSTLDVRLFEVFPGTERLRVQTISAAGQNAAELTSASHRLPL